MKFKQSLWLIAFLVVFSLAGQAIAQNKIIQVATEPAWIPYFGKDLKEGGIMVDITRQAFKRAGYNIKINWVPWKRALEKTYTGNYDVLLGCYYTDERAQKLLYTEPLTNAQVAFFELKDRNIKYKTLRDLIKYKIGVGRGYANTDEFDTADYLTKDESSDTATSIKKLLKGRIDLMIDSVKVVKHILNTQFPNEKVKISLVEPILQSRDLHIAFSRKVPNYKKMTEDFNKGLKMIKEDGTYDKILRSHGF